MMRVQPGLAQKYGFTLLEVVVAITIFGLCISLVYVLYNSVSSVVAAVEHQAERDSAAKTVLDRLSEDLAAVYVGKGGYVFGEQPAGFSTEDAVLDITTTAHLRLDPEAPPVDVTLVRYYLREQGDTGTFSLLRSDTPVMADIENSAVPEGQKHVLADEVLELEIVFIGQDGEEYTEWDSVADFDAEQETNERFPQAYKILLRLGTDGEDTAGYSSYLASVRAPASLIEFEGEE